MTDTDRAYWIFNHQNTAHHIWRKFQAWRRVECESWRPYNLQRFCRLHRQAIDSAIDSAKAALKGA